MIRTRLATLSLAIALSSASYAQAQMPGGRPSSRPLRIIFSGGVTVPTSDFQAGGSIGKIHATGYHGDVSLLLNLGGFPLRIRPEASLTHFDLKKALSSGAGGSGGNDGTSRLLGGLVNLEFSLGAGPIRPYILAGGGLTNINTDFSASSGSVPATVSETKYSIDGGAGIRFRLGPLDGFIEGRVNNVYSEKGAVNFKDVKLIPVTFGLVF
jgi:opacity protein-like surface antigen